mmetsp:Transcript_132681/g.322395  ORF Transcript_132681/g.322395 Transcript_132681/m.322395 type:complete len:573 (+) Transcript_132681:62-1780(+)
MSTVISEPPADTMTSFARRSTSESLTVTTSQFPMYVVSIKNLLTFDVIPMHEDLLEKGLLEKVDSENVCVHFISHVWLSRSHPDPDGVKLRHFKSVCHKILHGDPRDLFEAHDWEAFSTGCSAAKTFQALRSELKQSQVLDPESFKQDIEHGYCWWDYISVPQRTHTDSQAAKNQKMAISSIPHYIERSAYFWVVAPDALHAEKQQMVGYEVWQSRGWCRLEEWGNFLSIRVAPPLIVTSAQHVGLMDTMDFIALRSGIGGLARHAACQGRFTCCDMGHRLKLPDGQLVDVRCDKEEIEAILGQMLPHKLHHYKKAGKSFMWRFLTNATYSVYAGSTLMDPPKDAEELLLACGADAVDSNYEGLTPLTWACTYGSRKIVRELLDMGARADQSVTILQCAAQRGDMEILSMLLNSGHLGPEALCKGSPKANITSLDRGAKAGHGEICMCMLAAKASPHPVRKDNGQTPLHTAAEAGHPDVCKALLAAGAEKDVADSRGRTPLMLAAQRLTLFGKSSGKAQCARLLLKAQADPEKRDASGRLPSTVALDDGHQAFLDVLLEHSKQKETRLLISL